MTTYVTKITLILLLVDLQYQIDCPNCYTGCQYENGDCTVQCEYNYGRCYHNTQAIHICTSYDILNCQGECTQCLFSLCTGTCQVCSTGYPSGNTCLSCIPPCLNCSAPGSNCLSCVDTANMVVSNSKCICSSATKYLNGSVCSPCISPCTTCTGASTCTGCIPTKYLSGNSCLSCTPPCANCSGSSTHCDSCVDTVNMYNSSNQCFCVSGKYLSGSSCLSCTSPCATCSGSATQCQTCVDTSKMAVNSFQCHCTSSSEFMNVNHCDPCISPCTSCTGSATTCTGCIPTKYLSGNSCLDCTPPCANCSGSSTHCDSCVQPAKMGLSSFQCHCTSSSEYMNVNQCDPCTSPCTSCTGSATTCTGCIPTKYLSGNSCLDCTPPCANCSGSSTHCDSCVQPAKMGLSSFQCHCTSSSEYMNVNQCDPCTSPCTSCTGSATTCTGCIPTKYLSGNTCQDCSPPCVNCITTSATCQSCMDSSNMTLGGNTCTCSANTKYFNGSVCLPCTSPCLRCVSSDTNCTDCIAEYYLVGSVCNQCTPPCSNCLGTATHCTTCKDPTHMTLASNTCTCTLSNYFFNLTSNTCEICTSPCKTCETTTSNCTSCIDGNYLNSNLCPLCTPPCQNCVTTSTTCTLCMDQTHMTLLTNQCSCTNHSFYFDGSICQPCTSPCDSCVTSDIHCLTCVDSPNQTVNASFECICNDINAFFNGSICVSCTLPCKTCVNTSTFCLSCLDALQDNSTNQCLCPDSYYEDNTHYCSLCQPPCVNCVTLTQCISCVSGNYIYGFDCLQCVEPCKECEFATLCLNCIDTFMIVNQKQECVCQEGYFMSGLSCFPCQAPCLNCENYPYQCTSCLSNFVLEDYNCVCYPYTYLQIYPENICLRCQLPCLECELAIDHCDVCSDIHHNLINHKCICSYGYGTSGIINETCDFCIYPCATCSISVNYCQSCMDGGFQLVGGQCICQDGYYEQNQQCWKCENQCKRCIDTADNCLECSDLNSILSQGKCQCKYPGYLEIVGECIKCHPPCLNCFASVDLCISCIKPFQLAINYECICADGYYMDQNQDCQSCPLECKTCLNENICTSCINGYYFENYKCLKCYEPCQQCYSMQSCITCVDEYYSFEDKCLGCQYKCKTCVDSYSCDFCSDGYYLFNNRCLQCSDKCGTCLDSFSNCTGCIDENQIVIEGECICKEKYFQEKNSCKQCPPLCLQCTSQYYCQQCIIGAEIIHDDNQCKCQVGFFLTDQNQCIECSSNCKTCVLDASHCQSCSALRELSDKQCICKNGYYESDDGECEGMFINQQLDCNTEMGHLIKICQYENSIDGIWTWGEQCDDGNQDLRDGCSYNQIDPGYKCINILSQKSYCVKGLKNCQNWELTEVGEINCSQCQQGYFMYYEQNNSQKKICVKCSDRCLECQDSSINCTQCRFISINDQCSLCEQMQGKYSNYKTNKCYSKCGDSILADDEECDDGNNYDKDGCSSSCLLETGHECFESQCQRIQYPLPILTQIDSNFYNNSRSFVLEFDYLLYLKSNYFIEDLIQIDVGGQLNMSYFFIYLNQTKQIEQTNLTNLTVQIDIYFNDSCLNQILWVSFIQMDLITNKYGQSIQVHNISVNVDNYYKLETSTIIATQYAVSFNQYILIFLCILATISILFGGLEIFYNLMDTLQLISYLQYVNTNFPYNFETFLSLYQFAQLRFLDQFIDVQQYIDGMIPESYLNSLPSKFINDDLTPLFLINGSSILSVWVSFLGVFYLTKIAPFFLNLITTQVCYFDKGIRLTLKIFILKLKLHFLQISKSVQATFFFSGLIRTHMSTAYDFSFALILNLYSLELFSSNLLIQISSTLTLASLFVYLSIILFTTIFTDLNSISLETKKMQNLCGTIFEGLKSTGFSKYYNTFLLIKKLLFMAILVFPYQVPLYQIMNLLALSTINSIFLIAFRPLKEKSEFLKQVTCEVFLAITQLLLSVLAIDDIIQVYNQNERLIFGWCLIASISAILAIQVVIDCMQQWKFILKNYRSMRKLVEYILKKWKDFKNPPPKLADALIFV